MRDDVYFAGLKSIKLLKMEYPKITEFRYDMLTYVIT